MLRSPPGALPVALGPSAEPPRSPHAAAAASSSPPRPKRRFDIESLLAKPEPPRRRSPLPPPSARWPSPVVQRFGCAAAAAAGLLPFACLERPPPPPPPPPGCPRPVPGLVFSPCASPPSLGAALPWPSGGACKMKRVRTVFTPEQLERLEKEFLKQQYMVGTERVDLAATLHLTETQVKVWFQNRRIKWWKQSLEQKVAKLSQFGTTLPDAPGQPDSRSRCDEKVELNL